MKIDKEKLKEKVIHYGITSLLFCIVFVIMSLLNTKQNIDYYELGRESRTLQIKEMYNEKYSGLFDYIETLEKLNVEYRNDSVIITHFNN